MDWLARCDWSRRSPQFGALAMHELHAAMAYLPALPERAWQLWRGLPGQSNILRADAIGVLRYAALDWTHEPLELADADAISRFATWGLVLARAYRHLAAHVPGGELAWLARPLVLFDLEGVMRIGFLRAEAGHVPPETLDQWPLCDERALVFVVAQALVGLTPRVPWKTHLGRVLARALERDPAHRYRRLDELETQLVYAGAKHVPKLAAPRTSMWTHVEAGLGLLALDRDDLALSFFQAACNFDRSSFHARDLLAHTSRLVGTAAPRATASGTIAVDALPASPPDPTAATRALLVAKRFTDALAAAEALIATAPTDGQAHYLRGRALLALRRLVEARDAFERACVLAPQHIPAMWLRTAVDRELAKLRADVGVPVPMPVDLPPGPVRDALVAGRIDDAIRMLEPGLLLGDLLSYAGRFQEALRVFEQLEGEAALAGKARALIDLGRTDEALAVLATIDADADGFVTVRRSGRA